MKPSRFPALLPLRLASLVAGCGGGGAAGGEGVRNVAGGAEPTRVCAGDPDRFLEYFAPQAPLAPGRYTVRASQPHGRAGAFTLTLDRNGGAMSVRAGVWSEGGGARTFDLDLDDHEGR